VSLLELISGTAGEVEISSVVQYCEHPILSDSASFDICQTVRQNIRSSTIFVYAADVSRALHVAAMIERRYAAVDQVLHMKRADGQ
jgi:hypothetical protein